MEYIISFIVLVIVYKVFQYYGFKGVFFLRLIYQIARYYFNGTLKALSGTSLAIMIGIILIYTLIITGIEYFAYLKTKSAIGWFILSAVIEFVLIMALSALIVIPSTSKQWDRAKENNFVINVNSLIDNANTYVMNQILENNNSIDKCITVKKLSELTSNNTSEFIDGYMHIKYNNSNKTYVLYVTDEDNYYVDGIVLETGQKQKISVDDINKGKRIFITPDSCE